MPRFLGNVCWRLKGTPVLGACSCSSGGSRSVVVGGASVGSLLSFVRRVLLGGGRWRLGWESALVRPAGSVPWWALSRGHGGVVRRSLRMRPRRTGLAGGTRAGSQLGRLFRFWGLV